MSKFKTPLSLLLVLAMALSLGPVSAFADEFGNPSFDDNEVGQVIVGTVPPHDENPGVSVEAGTGSVEVNNNTNEFTVSDTSNGEAFKEASYQATEITVTVENPIVTKDDSDPALEVGHIVNENQLTVGAGDVTNEGAGGGVQVINNTPGTTNVTMTVTVEDISSGGTGLDAEAAGSGSTIDVTADSVTTVEGGDGVYMKVTDGGTASVTVGESATTGGEDAAPVIKAAGDGIEISNGGDNGQIEGGKAEAEINGNVEAVQTGVTILNQDEESISTVTINGNLEAGDKKSENIAITSIAILVDNDSEVKESAKVTVHGNVETTGTGLDVRGAGETDVYIEGTLSADQQAVVVDQLVTDNLSLTVWKIEVNGKQAEEGSIVGLNDGSGAAKQDMTQEETERVQAIENSINYIIKIDPQQTGNLSSNKATANANETVTITVTIPEGHTLKAVYTDEGETLTAQDNGDGTFSLTVPVGGGVYVHADFEEIPEPEPEPEPKRKYTQESEPVEMPKQEEKIEDTGMGTGGAPAKNEFLSVTDGTARYDLGNGEQKVTLLANTLKTLVKERGLKEFVFVMNGKTYTVKAEDLLAWLASSPSVVLYADGDRLVLDFGGGQVVVLEADDAVGTQEKTDTVGGVVGDNTNTAEVQNDYDTDQNQSEKSDEKENTDTSLLSAVYEGVIHEEAYYNLGNGEKTFILNGNEFHTLMEEKNVSCFIYHMNDVYYRIYQNDALDVDKNENAILYIDGNQLVMVQGDKTWTFDPIYWNNSSQSVSTQSNFTVRGQDESLQTGENAHQWQEEEHNSPASYGFVNNSTSGLPPESTVQVNWQSKEGTDEFDKMVSKALGRGATTFLSNILIQDSPGKFELSAYKEIKSNEWEKESTSGNNTTYVSGIVGANTAEVQNVYNTAPGKTEAGTEENSDIVGGVVGAGIAAVQSVYNTGEVQNNYNTASNETNAQQKQENKSTGTKTNGIYGLDGSGLDLGLDKVSMISKRTEGEPSELDSLMEKLYTRMWTFKNMMTNYEALLNKKYDAMESAINNLGLALNYEGNS